MGSIFDVLTEDSHRLLVDEFPFLRDDFKLCWYPSCGSDFRHIRYLEEERLTKGVESNPMMYVHSDMHFGMSNPKVDERQNEPYARGQWLPPGLRVEACHEVFVKSLFFAPSHEVWNSSAGDRFTGRAFALVLRFTDRPPEKGGLIPLLYFGYENLNLLVDCFVANRITIDTLVHIRDGGGTFGGSHFPMNFIYQVADLLNIRRVINDESVSKKHLNSEFYRKVLMRQCRKNPRTKDVTFAVGNPDSGQYFLDHCWERGVPRLVYGMSENSRRPDRGLCGFMLQHECYDWTRVSPDVFQASLEIARTEKPPDLLEKILYFPDTDDVLRTEILQHLWDLAGEGSREATTILGNRLGNDDPEYIDLLWKLSSDGCEFAIDRLAKLVQPDDAKYLRIIRKLARGGDEGSIRRLVFLVGHADPELQDILRELARDGSEFAIEFISKFVEPDDVVFLDILWQLAPLGNRMATDILGKLVDAGDPRFRRVIDIADKNSLKLTSIERKRKFLAWRSLMTSRSDQRNERERILAKIKDLPPLERIVRIASDPAHAINYFPAGWGKISDADLDLLDEVTVARLKEKLKYAKRGYWRVLREQVAKRYA